MTNVLHIIQNDPEVPPGNILDSISIPFSIHHPYRCERLPEAAAVSALIVLGGAMGADDDNRHPFLSDLKELIRTIVAAQIPYLGICLGGQLLAAAMGTQVVSNRWEELGTLKVSLTQEGITDRLFKGFSGEFTTFQWHHDSFDIPAGGTLLATSAACPHQAFRIGECAWGLQFHPEVTESIIRDWSAWDATTRKNADYLVREFSHHEDSYRATSRQLMDNFLLNAGLLQSP
jgi:GMP synthase-like glutamine amidotransferase